VHCWHHAQWAWDPLFEDSDCLFASSAACSLAVFRPYDDMDDLAVRECVDMVVFPVDLQYLGPVALVLQIEHDSLCDFRSGHG
jgi:hypothetical protein